MEKVKGPLQLTQFTNCKFELEDPVKLNVDMTFKNLNLLCGFNGVGKTFLNKMLYATHLFASVFLLEKTHGIKLNADFDARDTLQWILDNSFTDQNFNGEVKFYNLEPITGVPWEHLTFVLKHGQVQELNVDFMECTEAAMPTYLSAATRKFAALENFVTIKSLLGIETLEEFSDIDKLCEHFPLYDILAIEKLIGKFDNISAILAQLKEIGNGLSDEIPNISYIKVLKNKIVCDIDGKEQRITNLSAGHQALLIMFLGAM